jgi:hypothetical protein
MIFRRSASRWKGIIKTRVRNSAYEDGNCIEGVQYGFK